MKVCFFVDLRSPIAQNWVRYFIEKGDEVHIISSFPCSPDILSAASVKIVPIAFSWLTHARNTTRRVDSSDQSIAGRLLKLLKEKAGMRALGALKRWISPLELRYHCQTFLRFVLDIKPDLVHAMRIPFEGIMAAEALKTIKIPLIVSVWGNDFTLHAQHSLLLSRMTKHAMMRTDALHPDCARDLRLARSWGFDKTKPSIVLPSGGGIQLDVFRPGLADSSLISYLAIPEGAPIIINPRGVREYVRNDTFFQAIPLILSEKPNAIFLVLGMQGNSVAERYLSQLDIKNAVRLLPSVPRDEMANLFRLANIMVSPSEHDGTPNTLLEGMACGAFPIAGNIESVREWINDNENGLLCDPASAGSLAKNILHALEDEGLRKRAAVLNQRIISERACYQTVMKKADVFYREVLKSAGGNSFYEATADPYKRDVRHSAW